MAKFIYTWDSGFVSEVELPSKTPSCSMSYNSQVGKNTNATTGLINSASDPTADVETIGFLTDKLGYLTEAYTTATAHWNASKSIKDFWRAKYDWCRGCCSRFGCFAQCTCNQNAGACYKTESNLDSERKDWVKIVDDWKDSIAGIQTITDETNIALASVNAQIQTELEQANQQAQTNEIIAETNMIISIAKGKELEVEEQNRISKTMTIVIPILILLLIIILVYTWRKR